MTEDKKRFRFNIPVIASMPPLYKKRLTQGIIAYLILSFFVGAGVLFQSKYTVEQWEKLTPQSTAMISQERLGISSDLNFDAPDENVTAPAPGSRGSVAIIVTGLGLSHSATKFAIENLPKDITLAFSPYGSDVKGYLYAARRAKHETLVLMPMESTEYPLKDSGPNTLLINARDEDNNRNFFSVLALANSSIGIMNYMGSRFMTDEGKMKSVLRTIRAKNLLFIEDTEGRGATLTHDAAVMTGATYLSTDVLLDNPPTPENILQNLRELERNAAVKGRAVGVINAWPSSLDALKNWLGSLDSRGIRLVPLTAFVKKKQTDKK